MAVQLLARSLPLTEDTTIAVFAPSQWRAVLTAGMGLTAWTPASGRLLRRRQRASARLGKNLAVRGLASSGLIWVQLRLGWNVSSPRGAMAHRHTCTVYPHAHSPAGATTRSIGCWWSRQLRTESSLR